MADLKEERRMAEPMILMIKHVFVCELYFLFFHFFIFLFRMIPSRAYKSKTKSCYVLRSSGKFFHRHSSDLFFQKIALDMHSEHLILLVTISSPTSDIAINILFQTSHCSIPISLLFNYGLLYRNIYELRSLTIKDKSSFPDIRTHVWSSEWVETKRMSPTLTSISELK